MSEAQKSKRELKDVVDVFLSKSNSQEIGTIATPTKIPLAETQVITFFSPFNEEETFAFNALFPYRFTGNFTRRFLATNPPDSKSLAFISRFYQLENLSYFHSAGKKVELSRNFFWIFWPEKRFFEEQSSGLHSEFVPEVKNSGSTLITLDLLHSNVTGFDHLIRLLDQMVLVIRPTMEDMKNAYKVIKACYYINRQMETSVIFNAQMTQLEVEKIFSRFSEIVSEFLVLPVRCFGAASLDITSKNIKEQVLSQLNFDSMFLLKGAKPKQKTLSLERMRFLHKLIPIME